MRASQCPDDFQAAHLGLVKGQVPVCLPSRADKAIAAPIAQYIPADDEGFSGIPPVPDLPACIHQGAGEEVRRKVNGFPGLALLS